MGWLQLKRDKHFWPSCACGIFVGKMKCSGTFKTILKSSNKATRVSAIPHWLLLNHQYSTILANRLIELSTTQSISYLGTNIEMDQQSDTSRVWREA